MLLGLVNVDELSFSHNFHNYKIFGSLKTFYWCWIYEFYYHRPYIYFLFQNFFVKIINDSNVRTVFQEFHKPCFLI